MAKKKNRHIHFASSVFVCFCVHVNKFGKKRKSERMEQREEKLAKVLIENVMKLEKSYYTVCIMALIQANMRCNEKKKQFENDI